MDYAASPEFLGLQEAVAGRYSLDAEIGRGGMGIVYRARDVTLDRVVALKLLPPELARRGRIRERFLREARTAARLSHPNVVPIFAVEEVADFVFYVMAHVDGLTLAQRVATSGPLIPHAAVPVFREVAWALGYAHAQGIVHRDVKPENVMLESGSGRALVLDFGIAGAETEIEDVVLGTPHFMSPEQAAGEPTGPASDIYSLGATMFFALAGRPPFAGEAAPEIVAHHIRTPAPRLSEAAPGTPGKLAAIVDRCLRKEPGRRPARAEDVAEGLTSAIEAQKEVPVPVRAFVSRARQRRSGLVAIAVLYFSGAVFIPLRLLMGVGGGIAPLLSYMGAMAGLVVGIPTLAMAARTRRLHRAGFDHADLVRAFEEDYRQRAEELPFVYGPRNEDTVKWLRRTGSVALLGGAAGVLAGAAAAPALAPWGLVGMLAGLVLRLTAYHRSAGRERGRVTFWKGRIGRWLFKLGGWKLKRVSDAPMLTHRPTEMALGLSVLGLFEALPAATRSSLADLPGVVASLEEDAQQMRDRVRELDELLVQSSADEVLADRTEDSLAGQRARAVRAVREARERAAGRLAEAVAALENLRVDLLRIRAGAVSLESITENLGAAREVAAEVDRLIGARDEIEEELLR